MLKLRFVPRKIQFVNFCCFNQTMVYNKNNKTRLRNGETNMKKLVALFLTFILAFGMVACGGGEGTTKADTPKTYTQAEILEAANDVYGKLCEAKRYGDYNRFAAMFTETTDDVISTQYDAFKDSEDYDQHFMVNVCNDQGYYLVSCVNAIASGTYPNTHVSRNWFSLIIKETEEGWKASFGTEAETVLNQALRTVYPEGGSD